MLTVTLIQESEKTVDPDPFKLFRRWFDDAIGTNPPPAPGGKRIKIVKLITA